jgi:colanic acid biosynthesis protein WcaH
MAPEEYEAVVRLTPLVAMDLIVRSPDGKVLVGRRTNEPAKGTFFVPGSRISKNETRAAAFKRITREELGRELSIEGAAFRGVFEHLYPANRFEKPGFGTHYIVLAYEMTLDLDLRSLPQEQHGEYRWLSPEALLADAEVHPNTKAYFSSSAEHDGRSTLPPVR